MFSESGQWRPLIEQTTALNLCFDPSQGYQTKPRLSIQTKATKAKQTKKNQLYETKSNETLHQWIWEYPKIISGLSQDML